MTDYMGDILEELKQSSKEVNMNEFSSFIHLINNAKHIFLSGAGRSGLVTQCFANRLMHLGFSVNIVGEISAPHSSPGDLLVVCSSSGETASLKSLVKKAKQSEVKVALVTANKKSTLAKQADTILSLPGKRKNEKSNKNDFFQPMGSSFEQLAFLTFDNIVLNFMEKKQKTSEMMHLRHADFE